MGILDEGRNVLLNVEGDSQDEWKILSDPAVLGSRQIGRMT